MTEVTSNNKMQLSKHLALPSEAALGHSCVPVVASDLRSSANELDGPRLSPHFSLGEFTKSSYPEVYNIPSHVAIENMKRICGWLEVLRKRYNDRYNSSTPGPIPEQSSPTRSLSSEGGEYPIIINSGYRSPQLNKKVGGVSTSNHVTGCAVDIRCSGAEQAITFAYILLDYAKESQSEFDELFIEKNKYGRYWVHFAVRPKDNRRKIAFLNG